MQEKKKLLQNTFIIALGRCSTQVLSFLLLPLYTSLLSTSEYGNYDLLNTISIFIIPFITLLMEESMFRFLIDAKDEKEKAKSKKEIAKLQSAIVAVEDAHPRQPRCIYFGEEVQIDASIHLWFGNVKSALHAAIDDSTGQVLAAYFDNQETLNGYYNIYHQILTKYRYSISF